MKRYNPLYFLAEAFKGIFRNGVMTFASIAVLLSCLLVIGAVVLIVVNVDANLDNMNAMNQIVAFTYSDATEEEILEVEKEIKTLDNVGTIERRTKKELLDLLKAENPGVYDDITDEENPLADEFVISYLDAEKVTELDYRLKLIDGVQSVRNVIEIANTIQTIKHGITLIFSWFLVILFVISVFIIINTIKLTVFSRRKEISIMRYIGATGGFIITPFIIEGIIIGLVAGIAAFLIFRFSYGPMVSQIREMLQMIVFVSFSKIQTMFILGSLGIGVATGILGSLISVSKFVKE